ncbi:MAG: ABC transporter permease, partial [Deltaproteobacteria bacterium]|nr:ABC transporter permease [Deltaproteobacteria bacterium]
MKRYFINKNFSVGFCLSLIVLLMAITCFFWTPYNANSMNPPDRLQGPSLAHPFGTDQYGRDIL